MTSVLFRNIYIYFMMNKFSSKMLKKIICEVVSSEKMKRDISVSLFTLGAVKPPPWGKIFSSWTHDVGTCLYIYIFIYLCINYCPRWKRRNVLRIVYGHSPRVSTDPVNPVAPTGSSPKKLASIISFCYFITTRAYYIYISI